MAAPYDPDVYRRFAENLRASLDGPNIEHPSMRALRSRAWETAQRTANGSPLWFSAISSRMAAKTVYLGNGPEIVLPKPSAQQLALVEKAPDCPMEVTNCDLHFRSHGIAIRPHGLHGIRRGHAFERAEQPAGTPW